MRLDIYVHNEKDPEIIALLHLIVNRLGNIDAEDQRSLGVILSRSERIARKLEILASKTACILVEK